MALHFNNSKCSNTKYRAKEVKCVYIKNNFAKHMDENVNNWSYKFMAETEEKQQQNKTHHKIKQILKKDHYKTKWISK